MTYEREYQCSNCEKKIVETDKKCPRCGHRVLVVSEDEPRKSRK